MAFSLPNRLPTITIGYCFFNHHKPTTLCCHGNHFGYVVAYSFAYTMVSADFLRNVLIIRYLHLSTTTHTFLVFYSLDWMHCNIFDNDIKLRPLKDIKLQPPLRLINGSGTLSAAITYSLCLIFRLCSVSTIKIVCF